MNEKNKTVTINISITIPSPQSKINTCRCSASSTKEHHPENSLRQAGEILLKLVAGKYTEREAKGAWEILEALLNSYLNHKGTHCER